MGDVDLDLAARLVAPSEVVAESEDMLGLNVFTPSVAAGDKLPVLVWLHGGAFLAGDATGAWYDGSRLSQHNGVVVVSVHHRLGPLGHLYLGERDDEFDSSGNVGMLDLVAALNWVRHNIECFGGDPDNVTIFGQSGGGAKVNTLVAMPAARGLFHRAICMSGVTDAVSADDAFGTTIALCSELGLAGVDVAASQQLPARALLDAFGALSVKAGGVFGNRRSGLLAFGPVVDGVVLIDRPFVAARQGCAPGLDILVGSTAEEATLALMLTDSDFRIGRVTDAGVRVRLIKRGDLVSEEVDNLVAEYRAQFPTDSPSKLLVRIFSDQRAVHARHYVKAAREGGAGSIRVYQFAWQSGAFPEYGAYHGLDIPFVFNTVDALPVTAHDATSRPLAERMSRAWCAFARSGDPTHLGLLDWPEYLPDRRDTLIFDDETRLGPDPYNSVAEAWRDLHPAWGI